MSRGPLQIDEAAVVEHIARVIRSHVHETLHRRGAVVGLSGGVDSSVVAALCAHALGPEHVVALLMPERDSSDEALWLGRLMAERLGIHAIVEDIGPTLDAAGCYRRQMEAIRTVFPEYGEGWRCKLTLPSILEGDRLNVFSLTVEDPSGTRRSSRMSPAAYLQLVAATNFKQRTRKMIEYYHADRLQYAVAGTPTASSTIRASS